MKQTFRQTQRQSFKWHELLTAVCFFAFFLSITALTFLLPQQTRSESESRALTERPAVSRVVSVVAGTAEGSAGLAARAEQVSKITSKTENYLSDHVPARAALVRSYSEMERAIGKKQVRSVFCLHDDMLFTRIWYFSKPDLAALAQCLAQVTEGNDCRMIWCILPIKNAILSDYEPTYFSGEIDARNREMLLDTFGGIDGLTVLDGARHISQLTPDARLALVFKTDHHWNARGAYTSAADLAQQLAEGGMIAQTSVPSNDDFAWTDLTGRAYQGDLNRRFYNRFSVYETLELYAPTDPSALRYYTTLRGDEAAARASIVASRLDKEIVDYNDVFTDNLGYLRVENPNAPEDQAVLILKDSYQNPMLDYFTAIFREVNVIDPRNYQEDADLSTLVAERGLDMVLFLYHQDNISTELIDFLQQ